MTNIEHSGFDIGVVGASSTGGGNLVPTNINPNDATAWSNC